MRPVLRYQSQLLYRKSYKPVRWSQLKPAGNAKLVFRPKRAAPIGVVKP
jgi:hypothetical protein